MRGFLGQFADIDGCGLHAIGEFVGGDAAFKLLVCRVLRGVTLIESACEIECIAL